MAFSDKLDAWYNDNGRTLPWRGIDDPYRIWLSEIILQQTRIEQGRDYYLRFVEAFPTVADLAAASEEQVLRLWQGLGYYSRARNLHAAAQYIMDECGGRFPSTYEGILKLKGVGRYTAAAIASFAYRLPHPVIDGNVYRFISRLRGISTPIATDAAYSEFERLLLTLIDRRRPEPVKAPKAKPVDRWFYYFDLRWNTAEGGQTLMQRRAGKDIWRGLWQFPLMEADHELAPDELVSEARRFAEENFQLPDFGYQLSAPFRHQLTHRTIHALFLRAELPSPPAVMPADVSAVDLRQIKNIPLPRLIDRYLQNM